MKQSIIYGLGCVLSMSLLAPSAVGTTSLELTFAEAELASLVRESHLAVMEAPTDLEIKAPNPPVATVTPSKNIAPRSSQVQITLRIVAAEEESVAESIHLTEEMDLEESAPALLAEEDFSDREELVIESEIAVPSQLLAE